MTDLGLVFHAAKDRFVLDLRGIHGIRHWTRVRENGHRLAKHTNDGHPAYMGHITIAEMMAPLLTEQRVRYPE